MRFMTAGESHGPQLTLIVDDVPAGMPFYVAEVNHQLQRRQLGYGRGARMTIEKDEVELVGGVRFGYTTGAPVAMRIANKDFVKWQDAMAPQGEPGAAALQKRFSKPRPGHADLAGFYKYGHTDLRDVLERASARETAARVAAGSVARQLLQAMGVVLTSHVVQLGPVRVNEASIPLAVEDIMAVAEQNDCRTTGNEAVVAAMHQAVDEARQAGTTLGGEIEVVVDGLPAGLGSYTQWDRKLDGQLAQAVMSIPAVKSVSIGAGAQGSDRDGATFHDAIVRTPEGLTRATNRAGGLEAGVTNGMPLVVRAIMKPIATLRVPLDSVNLDTGEAEAAHFERSDVTAVPACGVVAEAMVAFILARAVMEKFGHDSLPDMLANKALYLQRIVGQVKTVPGG
ncbi:MAG: chorismate synthase [Vampirovibrionales bacterium]